jgi:hypothetical protein
MIFPIVAVFFLLTTVQATVSEKSEFYCGTPNFMRYCNLVKLDTLLIANLDQLLRRNSNSDYNLEEHPFQIIPLEMRMRTHQNPHTKTNRTCHKCKLDLGTNSDTFYELALPSQFPHNHPLKNEDQLEGILLPFMMPTGGGFFGRK